MAVFVTLTATCLLLTPSQAGRGDVLAERTSPAYVGVTCDVCARYLAFAQVTNAGFIPTWPTCRPSYASVIVGLPCLVETDALHLPASAKSGGPVLHRITLIAALAAVGGFLLGYHTGLVGGTAPISPRRWYRVVQ
jgi:hypothetical protein